jgi:hypothetical protein
MLRAQQAGGKGPVRLATPPGSQQAAGWDTGVIDDVTYAGKRLSTSVEGAQLIVCDHNGPRVLITRHPFDSPATGLTMSLIPSDTSHSSRVRTFGQISRVLAGSRVWPSPVEMREGHEEGENREERAGGSIGRRVGP